MIPHAKIVLSFLIAASNVHLILTGTSVPDVEQVLHNDIRDSASPSTSTENIELVNEGRDVTRLPRADGKAIHEGQPIVPVGRTVIFVPNHLKADQDIINQMHLEYNSIRLLLLRLPHYTEAPHLAWNIPPETYSDVLVKLSDYHKRYLLGAASVGPHADGAVAEDLRKIFNIITFPHLSQHDWLSDDEKYQRTIIPHSLHVKTSFEKCFYKTLDYLYRFEIISSEEMRLFFNSPDTLQRTATHLSDLFSGPKWAFTEYHTFVPELNFILKDWHTEHLHRCLKDLDKPAQQQLVYETLRITIRNLKHLDPNQSTSPPTFPTNEFVYQRNFLQMFQGWTASHPADNDDLLSKNIKEMITLFLKPRDPNLEKTDAQDFQKTEVLLNYYTLRFIKEYANRDLNELIEKLATTEDFKAKFEWTKLRLDIWQLLRWKDDYDYFRIYPEGARSIIPAEMSREGKELLDQELSSRESDFKAYEDRLNWFAWFAIGQQSSKPNAIAEYVKEAGFGNWNAWLRPRATVSTQPGDKGEFDKLMEHLLVNYNGLDYTFSRDEWESAKNELEEAFLKEMRQRHSRRRNRWNEIASDFHGAKLLRKRDITQHIPETP